MRVIRSGDILFLAGGNNEVLRLYDADGFAALVPVDSWRARIAARDALFARLGIPWCLLLAPEKLGVLGDDVMAEQVRAGHVTDPVAPGSRLAALLAMPSLATPLGFLREQVARGYALYPTSDSHWTCLGALSAFQWIAPRLGLRLDYAPFAATRPRTLVYHGDLWSDRYPDLPMASFERRCLPESMVRTHANGIVRLKEAEHRENEAGLHVGSHVVYRNDEAALNERLVLFGSSFSDYRAECSLLTFVAALFFREVHFVWSSSLDIGLIERIAPDRVLVEMPERFLTACPDDSFDMAAHEDEVLTRWRRHEP